MPKKDVSNKDSGVHNTTPTAVIPETTVTLDMVVEQLDYADERGWLLP